MRASELPPAVARWPVTYAADEVPHLTIEPTTECNLRCRLCYRTERAGAKTLDQVKAETDLGLRLRRLESISLVGGEPTLHPELPAIVAHAKARGLLVNLVTNGERLLDADGPTLLAELGRAGLDRVVLHVDEGQREERGDPAELRAAIFPRIARERLPFSLSLTLFPNDIPRLPALLRDCGRFPGFDGALTTLALEAGRLGEPGAAGGQQLREVHRAMAEGLGLQPTAYLPSSLDRQHVTWLLYFYLLNSESGAVFGVSPVFNRLFRQAHRTLRGRHVFSMAMRPDWARLSLLASAAGELALSPRRGLALARLFEGSRAGRALRFHYLIVQRPPERDPRSGRLHLCFRCPDATVRDGRLTPVCLADRLRPLGRGPTPADAALAEEISAHLEPPARRRARRGVGP